MGVVDARLLVLAIVVLTAAAGSVATAAHAPSSDAKKRCKIVKKRVHGHVKRVRVCTKPKPAASLPSTVSVTLDSSHAATASISAEAGATLTAGGATLTVPAGAVAQPTTVTLTPVNKLGGLKGKIAGAVQLEPNGLQLLQPVTLTLDVPSASGLKAFTYSGNGTDLHLYPVKVAGGKATLDLIHFSGYGVGEGLPRPAIARVRHFLTTEVKPLVEQAKGDSRYLAVAALRTWELVMEMASLPTDDFVELYPDLQGLQADLGVALRKLADDQHAKCVETHDIVGTGKETEYTVWLVLPLLFIKSQPLADAVSYARARMEKCKRFELDFESVIIWQASEGRAASDVRTRSVVLSSQNQWTNQQPLEYVTFDFLPGVDPSPCTLTTSKQVDEPFHAKLSLDATRAPPNIVVQVDAGRATETVTLACPMGITSSGHPAYWSSGLALLHGSSSSFTISDWEYVGGAIFARRTYATSAPTGDGTVSEQTTFVLRHTPE